MTYDSVPSVHHNGLKSGASALIPSHLLSMRHYWGGRMQNWQPAMPADVVKKTMPEPRMMGFVDALLACRRWNHTVAFVNPAVISATALRNETK
jgi:hypothetical protein